MTRTLFFLTALAGMLAALSAIMIRIELTYPGVSPLFQNADGFPDGQHFNTVATAHAVFTHLCVTLLGTTLCAAARGRKAMLASVFTGLGIAASLMITSLIVLAEIPTSAVTTTVENIGAGWALPMSLAPNRPASALELLMQWTQFNPILAVDFTRFLVLPAIGTLMLGLNAMLSTVAGFRWVGVLGAVITLGTLIVMAPRFLNFDLPLGATGFVILFLPFIACASIRLIDEATPWLLMVCVGAIVVMVAQFLVLLVPNLNNLTETLAAAAMFYVFPLGLAWYALPAVLVFTHPTQLTTGAIFGCIGTITLGLCLWIVPMVTVGVMGQPARYVDYPDPFATLNLNITTGAFLFTLIYLGVIILIRRNRA